MGESFHQLERQSELLDKGRHLCSPSTTRQFFISYGKSFSEPRYLFFVHYYYYQYNKILLYKRPPIPSHPLSIIGAENYKNFFSALLFFVCPVICHRDYFLSNGKQRTHVRKAIYVST